MGQKNVKDEPRDQFTLSLVTWIQEILSSNPQVADATKKNQEYFKLLDSPLDAVER
ncbi:MAG: hypothetical protein WC551_06325 [Patescibacteria group bacterium]